MVPSVAFAFDWSIRASESETVELNSNQFLRNSPAGSVGSYTTLNADAEARTPTTKFNFVGDGTYKKYWGPGAAGAASEFLNYGFKARYELQEKNRFDREYVEASWRQQSTALALLNDFGVSTQASGFIDRLTATGGIDRSITAIDTLSLFATSTRTSYEPSSGGTPFTDTLARGNWRRSLSSVTAINLSSEYELLEYGNAFNSQVQIFREQAGFDTTLSALLSFRANAGVAYLVTDRGLSSSAFGGTTSVTPVSSSVLDWIGDAVLTYRMLKSTTLSVVASQSVGPSIVGSLFKRDSITASVTHSINSQSTLTLSASGNRQIATTTTDYASASATYSYNPIRDWTTSVTYRYLHRFASTGTTIFDPITGTPTVSGTGPADSHSLMFVVTHNWTVLPSGN
jgi:hypothetical protein